MSGANLVRPQLHVLGVRHHGPGSARAVQAALQALSPDCVLVEGPPDADSLIPWLVHPAMVMPVALLTYRPDAPRRASFFPFAEFSPEYQALHYALAHGAAAGFMDLPNRHMLATDARPQPPDEEVFNQLARATGYPNYELWWNRVIEQRLYHDGVFDAVLDLMRVIRAAAEAQADIIADNPGQRLAHQREAAMRQVIRAAAAAGHQRIVAVCGAWHAPALVDALQQSAEPDAALLEGLPAVDVDAAWVPWTYGRLAQGSGYGAGIRSPGWYDHLWRAGDAAQPSGQMSAVWLGKVAGLLRSEGFDVSPAHVIDAVRLAEALAAMRNISFPGLNELNEATESVMCEGERAPMDLVQRRLIVGERMGMVPPNGPAVPLQRDLRQEQQRLELLPDPEAASLALDLRRERDLDRSRLFHRLNLLDIAWARSGANKARAGMQMGTFNEPWTVQWLPELSLRVLQAAMWGNTVRDAAAACVADSLTTLAELPALTRLIEQVMQADLPELLPSILSRIEELAATSYDVAYMLDTLPPLLNILRYGGLRSSPEHVAQLRQVFNHLVTRACLGLPRACGQLDDTAAAEMADRLVAAHSAIHLEQDVPGIARWQATLADLADRLGIHGLVAGRATRLMHEAAAIPPEEVSLRFERALAIGGGTREHVRYAADWLDGFLRDSGLLLVHDTRLWQIVDDWLIRLEADPFMTALPLLRRTFASFPEGIRRQLQERATHFQRHTAHDSAAPALFDPDQAAAALPVISHLLGLRGGHQPQPTTGSH